MCHDYYSAVNNEGGGKNGGDACQQKFDVHINWPHWQRHLSCFSERECLFQWRGFWIFIWGSFTRLPFLAKTTTLFLATSLPPPNPNLCFVAKRSETLCRQDCSFSTWIGHLKTQFSTGLFYASFWNIRCFLSRLPVLNSPFLVRDFKARMEGSIDTHGGLYG